MAVSFFVARASRANGSVNIATSSGSPNVTTSASLTSEIPVGTIVSFTTNAEVDEPYFYTVTAINATQITLDRNFEGASATAGKVRIYTTDIMYLVAEQLEISGEEQLISPTIPGNSSTSVRGTGGNNFIVNLGTQRTTIRVTGFLVPLSASQFADLSGSKTRYLFRTGVVDGTTSLVSPTHDQTGKDMREVLMNFWADQSSASYNIYWLGWPQWGSSTDITIAGTTYRLWEGMMRSPRVSETAGEPDQFPYSFTWTVGDV